MTGPEPTDRLWRAQAWVASEVPGAPTAACPTDDAIAAMAEGRLDAQARESLVPHLADCARCRRAVASVSRTLADGRVASEIAALEGTRQRQLRRLAWIALPLAAASVLVLLVGPRPPAGTGVAHRAPTVTAAPAPAPVFPVGTVAVADSLRWTSVPEADRYRATLFDTEGSVVYETELGDTVVGIPDSVRPSPGRTYLWRIGARTGFDRWSASPLIEFSVRGPSQ